MAKKQFTYKGKTIEELKELTAKEFSKIAPSRIRRSIQRGFNDSQQVFLEKLRAKPEKAVKTHCRDMPVLPEMIGKTIKVYNGKQFHEVRVSAEMLGHYISEFASSRAKGSHSSPGVGATRSSAHTSVK